jgi:hypothetical protein
MPLEHMCMRERGGIAPPFVTSALNVSDRLHAPAPLPAGKEPPVPLDGAPDPVWTLLSREKSLASVGNQTLVI